MAEKKTIAQLLIGCKFLRAEANVRAQHLAHYRTVVDEILKAKREGRSFSGKYLRSLWDGDLVDALGPEATELEIRKLLTSELKKRWYDHWPHLTTDAVPKVILGVEPKLPIDTLRGNFGQVTYRQVSGLSGKRNHAHRQKGSSYSRALPKGTNGKNYS